MTELLADIDPARDDRRTAALAGWSAQPASSRDGDGTLHIHSHELARAVLRAQEVEQSGFGADITRNMRSLMRLPMLFLEGEEHQQMRRGTARFFTPRACEDNYRELIERETQRLIGDLVEKGEGRLDAMAMDLAVTVAAEIVGLTEHTAPGMPRRILTFLSNPPIDLPMSPRLVWRMFTSQVKLGIFYLMDVRPSVRTRRTAPRNDVISHLLAQGYKTNEILTECVLYGAAGMVTTREFITIAGIHLIENAALRQRFLAANDAGQRDILEEILRLEPVIGRLRRRAVAPFTLPDGESVAPGQEFTVDVRSTNADEAAVGKCPFHADPDRVLPDPRTGRPAMSFGDGRHRCPGAYVAIQESAIFLDALLRLDGLGIAGTPELGWSNLVGGYEFKSCAISLRKTPAAS